jgi:hypothetical protein
MRTLVYFASGRDKPEYQELDYDSIILIDNCFKIRWQHNRVFNQGKVTCVGMDCLESIEYLKKENIKIDCFVSLNEGLGEGGGSYAINSDFFLGYVMPHLRDNYIHIMNRDYYHNRYNVTMDLPYNMREISENEKGYISPFVFSKYDFHKGHAKVYQMTRVFNTRYLSLNPRLKVSVNHDSIWNHYDNLDLIAFSFSQQGQGDFFDCLPKTINLRNTSIDQLFTYCKLNRINKVGFTPLRNEYYHSFINQLRVFNEEYPKEIFIFHLNRNEIQRQRQDVGNNI